MIRPTRKIVARLNPYVLLKKTHEENEQKMNQLPEDENRSFLFMKGWP
jgi:hypothetical protein